VTRPSRRTSRRWTTIENDKGDVFPEETLVARLQSGQLDAAFFYTAEAIRPTSRRCRDRRGPEGHLHDLHAQRARPTSRAPRRSSRNLLGPDGQAFLKQDGFDLITPPKTTGSGIPASVKSALG